MDAIELAETEAAVRDGTIIVTRYHCKRKKEKVEF